MKQLIKQMKKEGIKKIFVQAPEGLKIKIQEIVDDLEVNGFEVFTCIEPCFGACDIRCHDAKDLGADAILNIGHGNFGVKCKIPIFYYHYTIDIDPIPLLEYHLGKLERYKKIGLVTTIQFVHILEKVKNFLEEKNFEVRIGKSSKGVEGQILGCDHSAGLSIQNEVDCFLFIGSGRFHPLGLQEVTNKPVLFLDIERNNLTNFYRERERMETLRLLRVEKAKSLENFGIIISTKPGQFHLKLSKELKEKLKSLGKNVYTLVSDQLTPEKLMGLKIDVLVNTACPRIREDASVFRKVILDPEDVEKLA
jgi:2-(3-amino-3-carboxypropyl)histidine synthase